ncbi:MAG: DNA polymerase III subunit delta [Arsenophonus sp.]
MIRIYPEQLTLQLSYKLKTCYLIFGNDPFLSEDSIDKICQTAKQKDFTERYTYLLDTNTNWESIYFLSQSFSLFSNRQILILTLPKNGPNTIMAKNLLKLTGLLHPDLLLILRGMKLSKAQENSSWYKKICEDVVYINCLIPEQSRLSYWITQRVKMMSASLDKEANQLLCYCYEGNLMAIDQILERLSILYSDNNFTLSRVKKVVDNAVNFTPYHWVDALLAGEIKRGLYILQQLQRENSEIIILLHIIQRELILLITLKQQSNDKYFKKLLDEYKIWKARRSLIITAVHRIPLRKLQIAIELITQAELHFKQDYDYDKSFFSKLEILSILLCKK